jgi:5S rRNA maturation endonuclease (ribonuclease M5)
MKGFGFREAMDYLKKESLGGAFTHSPKSEKEKAKAFFKEIGAGIADTKQPKAETKSEKDAAPRGKQLSGEEPATPPLQELSLATVSNYYHKRLLASPQALAYLKQRGFNDAGLYSRFKVGYADGSLLSKVTNGHREHLKTLGILNATGYEHFNGCITLPLYDEAGQIVGMYGRKLDDGAKVKHLYLAGGHKGLFNPKAARVYEELILSEAIIDALSLVASGIENVIPLYGTQGLTAAHLAAFKEHRVKTLIIALDNDEAGRLAAAKLKETLLGEGYHVKTIFPPHAKDWNEELTGGSLTKANFNSLLAEAETSSPLSASGKAGLAVERDGLKYIFRCGELTFRLVGVKELFVSALRVNVKAECGGESFYDNLDLYSARSRLSYSQSLRGLFGLELKVIENALVAMLEYLEAERDQKLAELSTTPQPKELTEEERALGLSFLQSPGLFHQIVEDMEALGYVGEELNKQLVYLAASSRKLDDPISILILSQSASGKSYLVDTVKELMPEEDVVALTSLSDQALNYIPDGGLLHKFLILGEAVHSEVIEHQIREMLSSKCSDLIISLLFHCNINTYLIEDIFLIFFFLWDRLYLKNFLKQIGMTETEFHDALEKKILGHPPYQPVQAFPTGEKIFYRYLIIHDCLLLHIRVNAKSSELRFTEFGNAFAQCDNGQDWRVAQ